MVSKNIIQIEKRKLKKKKNRISTNIIQKMAYISKIIFF